MGITALLMMALTRFQEYYLLRLETKLALTTSARFFHHVLRLPVTYFAQRYAGEIGSRVMINDKVAQLLSGRLATTILDCVLVVFYATLMFFYDVDHDRGGHRPLAAQHRRHPTRRASAGPTPAACCCRRTAS